MGGYVDHMAMEQIEVQSFNGVVIWIASSEDNLFYKERTEMVS